MCGIVGGNNPKWDYENAVESIRHRGPDGDRIVKLCDFTMGFVRLSILDLSDKGMQPMTGSNGTVISFNGEIYGFQRLRKELEKLGHSFQSNTDTEVLLNAYIEWGMDFVDHIDGMFAIAIYDPQIKKVILVRDRAGIKPLYYYYDGKRFAYASEIKALKTLMSDVSFDIDNTAVFDFFNYYYIPDPKTLYKKIYKLESGHMLVFDLHSSSIDSCEAYWSLNVNSEYGKSAATTDAVDRVKSLIHQSVEDQLVADVPIGGFLSGGIDSSIITAEALACTDDYGLFSIGFYDYEMNELPYVRCMEERFGFRSNKYYVKKMEFDSLREMMPVWFDELYADTSAYPSYVVSREAKKACKVMLAGDGGDEIFGGYNRYLRFAEYSKEHSNDDIDTDFTFITRELYGFLSDTPQMRKRFGIIRDYDACWAFRKYYNKDLPPITRLQYMDYYTYMPGDTLTKMDRVSMACSLEVRVPLLSKDIIEFCFSLSQQERCFNNSLKDIIKRAYTEIIPNNLIHRRKAGFSIPTGFFGYGKMPQEALYTDIYHMEG